MAIELINLNDEQKEAYFKILEKLKNPLTRVILLEGKPGTGKTYLLKYILNAYKSRAILTAPTNKATKVLRDMTTSKDYEPEYCTIYSLLGLQLSTSGEIKEVQASKYEVDISKFPLVVIDEAFMISTQLKEFLDAALEKYSDVKFLMLGDRKQLPPVKESISPIVEYFKEPTHNLRLQLTQVMRHEGDILRVADQVRTAIDKPFNYQLDFLNEFKASQVNGNSVVVLNQADFLNEIKSKAKTDKEWVNTKVIAWRNVTVDYFNSSIRDVLFPKTAKVNYWEIGDRVTLTAPAKDWSTDKIIATVDEMGIVEDVVIKPHPSLEGIDIARLTVLLDDNTIVTLNPIAPHCKEQWTKFLMSKFEEARMKMISWKHYWELHDHVHYIKHGYAITAHRAQGSTYDTVYVNLNDILRNSNRVESLQCLGVAMSRAKNQLIIGR